MLIVLIFNISYFGGLSWFIFCKIEHKINTNEVTFIENFNLEEKLPYELSLLSTYFMFTTLSTVGLGDFYP